MKILQVCPGNYVSGAGGVSEHVVRVSEGLVKLGHDVTVFATNPGGLAWFEVVNDVKVRRFKRFAPGKAYFFSPAMFLALKTVNGFDVVHAHSFHAFPMHFASFAKSKRFVVTAHFHGSGHSVFRDCLFRILGFFGWVTLLKADVIVAVSDFERNLLVERFRLDKYKVVMVPNGVDFSEFNHLRRRDKDFKSLLYVGRLEDYKGVHYLIEALPKLADDVVLEIVGNGSLRKFLKQRAKQLGVSKRVRFYQNLNRRDLLQQYANADVFVLMSKHEAYGLVVAEALKAGIPCIVANTSSLSEWVDNERCFGVSYPIRIDELVKIIRFVLDRGIRGRVFSNKYVNSKILDWKDVVCQLEELYFLNR